jgi:predicted LPLAT superfamily acyltransferase
MLGLYRGGNRYDIYFEELADTRHTERAQRDRALAHAVRSYVARLEHYCRIAPYNWFNFHDVWK